MSLHQLKPFEPLNIQEGNWIVEVTIRHESSDMKKPMCSYVLKAPIGYDSKLADLNCSTNLIVSPKEKQ